jgi:hypothetical protein
MDQDTAVGRLFGPPPFNVQLEVTVGFLGTQISMWFSGGMDDPVLHPENIPWIHFRIANKNIPVLQVFAVIKYDLVVGTA